jgi:hypothetical protein
MIHYHNLDNFTKTPLGPQQSFAGPHEKKEMGMMTSTIGAVFPTEHFSRWNLLFAQEHDKDLEFDEGLEDDELHESKPPSRRPLLWIILVLLAIGVAYWTLNPNSSFIPKPASMDTTEMTGDKGRQQSHADIAPPTFQETQIVSLSNTIGDSMLMGDPANTKPGPMVKPGETLTILDGSYQTAGWVYQVQTPAGKTGWISAEKLKKQP